MNDQLDAEVKKVEEEYIAQGKTFTAMDISNTVKQRGVNVRHRDVSPIVRQHFEDSDMYADANYTRELVPVNNGKAQAFVYFNIDGSPQDYQETNQEPVAWDPNKPMFPSIDDAVTADSDVSSNGVGNNGTVTGGNTGPVTAITAPSIADYVASRRSKVRHGPDCMYAKRIKPGNMVQFDGDDAVAGKYRDCRREV